MFEIPVVLFIFKRDTGLKKIIERIKIVKPKKLYLIADGPRNSIEEEQTKKCRTLIESLIDWDCEIIKNYAETNRGVYSNIGEGAKWVLSKEKWAIFLEDDNLPEVSFFSYCEELLEKYEENDKILWICGTNYLEEYESQFSYMFTKHLLPCGWASWSNKFLKYYDGLLLTLNNKDVNEKFRLSYSNSALYKQQLRSIKRTKYLLSTNKKISSWDYQMVFSVRSNEMYGISPKVNLIENIGVDAFSEHGGNSKKNKRVNQFCGMKSKEIQLPLKHPSEISIDEEYEKRIGKIILYPLSSRIMLFFSKYIKKILRLNEYDSLQQYFKK